MTRSSGSSAKEQVRLVTLLVSLTNVLPFRVQELLQHRVIEPSMDEQVKGLAEELDCHWPAVFLATKFNSVVERLQTADQYLVIGSKQIWTYIRETDYMLPILQSRIDVEVRVLLENQLPVDLEEEFKVYFKGNYDEMLVLPFIDRHILTQFARHEREELGNSLVCLLCFYLAREF
ncbi:hypothetical protein SELMODRAFT_426624 [Selaginella moellendorffii]|uniref:Uncharacterized protein n=1 Tax=Selaginella moellendorffii TaxID=88036 RepID=D8SWZ2_SELML|nr:hypothetical protein SELMODRAFT_426624 [Selaginella moellendorffii]